MDSNFKFPRQIAPIPRSGGTSNGTASTPKAETPNRESNALRASVLDAALQLGLANNSIVADWIFNNPVTEGDEEEPVSSPSLTYGSSATSEESIDESSSPYFSSISTQASPQQHTNVNTRTFDTPVITSEQPDDPSDESFQDPFARLKPNDAINGYGAPASSLTFAPTSIPPRTTTPSGSRGAKLRKRRDGYDSDGGYLSDTGKKKDKKDKKKDNAAHELEKERAKAAKAQAKEEKLQERREKEEERKRKKSLLSASKTAAKKDADFGYETDGGSSFSRTQTSRVKLKKSKVSGDGYETDNGYQSTSNLKKSKTRFFKLGTKNSRPDLSTESNGSITPPVVKKEEPMPLPIAERFAKTLATTPSPTLETESIDATPSRANTPQPQVRSMTSTPTFIKSQPQSAYSTDNHSTDRDSYGSSVSPAPLRKSSKRDGGHFSAPRDSRHSDSSTNHSINTSTQLSPASTESFPLSPITPNDAPPHRFLDAPTFRNSRSPSPTPSTSMAPLRVNKASISKPILSSLTVPNNLGNDLARAPSPAQNHSPISPYVVVTPITGSSPSPSPLYPRNIKSDNPEARPQNITSRSVSPAKPIQNFLQRPVSSVKPSSDYIVPSPRASPIPSANPNVLAYYDIPPPNPPPAAPLPNVPPSGPPPSPLRARLQEPVRSIKDQIALFNQPIPSIQRGKETPFPPRPLLPGGGVSGRTADIGMKFEDKVNVKRYRDLYAINTRQNSPNREQNLSPQVGEVVNPAFFYNHTPRSNGIETKKVVQDDDVEGIKDVLQRYDDTSSEGHEGGKALESRRSFEALKEADDSFCVTDYYGDERDDEDEDDDRTVDFERNNRWSGSIYSRASIMDTDKSEATRERFIQRVEAMLKEQGRGEPAIPPVPKLPEGLVGAKTFTAGKSWNRF